MSGTVSFIQVAGDVPVESINPDPDALAELGYEGPFLPVCQPYSLYASSRAGHVHEPQGPRWEHARRAVFQSLVASLLDARLVHTREERLARFQQTSEDIHLDQLSALFRPHLGTLGQGFEIAVNRAINEQQRDVVLPINKALARLNTRGQVRQSHIIGLEKWGGIKREVLTKNLTTAVPTDARLHTALVGGPLKIKALGQRLMDGTFALPNRDRADESQMHRADLLLVTDADRMVLASVKIRGRDVDPAGWKHVPLWIVGDRTHARHGPKETRQWPISVARVGDRWVSWLIAGDAFLTAVMNGLDRGTRPNPKVHFTLRDFPELTEFLWKRHHTPAIDVIAELRARVPKEALLIAPPPSIEAVKFAVLDNVEALPISIASGADGTFELTAGGLYVPDRRLLGVKEAA